MNLTTDFSPHKFQLEFLKNWRRFNVLVCHRRWGKTDLACAKLIASALTVKTKERHFAYICPLKGQAKDNSWHKFLHMLASVRGRKIKWQGRRVNVVSIRNTEGEIEFFNGATIKIYGADRENAERIRGMALAGCVMDEIGDIDSYVWDEIVAPTLNSTKGWCLFIGTPKGPNLFKDLYDYGLREDVVDSGEWYSRMYRLTDTYKELYSTGIREFDWCSVYGMEALRSRYTDRWNKYLREYECDFEADIENAVIPAVLIKQARNKPLEPDQFNLGVKVLGVDVARKEGGDDSVLCKRQGLLCHPLRRFNGVDNMELAAIVSHEIITWQPDAVFIDAGRGEGVIDRLRQLGHKVMEVPFGGRAMDPVRYYDKRTEMYFRIYDWLKEGGSLPDDRELCRELGVAMYDENLDKYRLNKKSEMKAILNRSPDSADALALAVAMPVTRREDTGARRARTTSMSGYSPLKRRAGLRRRT